MLIKNTLLKIKKSLGRYISLLIIVMVGVGFFAGVQITSPDIINVADGYYKAYKLFDFKINGTLGLTESDLSSLRQIDGVKAAIGSYSKDVISGSNALRVHALEEGVNLPKLTSGRWPQTDYECIADAQSYKIGDVIKLSDDVLKELKNTEFNVVGLIDSCLYLYDDYGSTNVGNGKLSSFIFIKRENFTLEAFTEIYLTAEAFDAKAYGGEYDGIIDKLNDALVSIKPDRELARYEEIYNKAQDIIDENVAKLNDEKAKAETEFADAKQELDDNMIKLSDGRRELKANEDALKDAKLRQTAEFSATQGEIAKGYEAINATLSEMGMTIDDIDLAIGAADSDRTAQSLEQLKITADTLREQEARLNEGIAAFASEMKKAESKLNTAKDEIAENETKLNEGYEEYYANLFKYRAEIADAEDKINKGRAELLDLERPKWYIFDRNAAVGYAQLGSSIEVVTAVSNILPLFFILIAMLMTSNSMTRMIAEERGELGTLASLGFSDASIIANYLLYVLSASGLGVTIGFFVGCRFIPPLVYNNFTFRLPPLSLRFNLATLFIIFAISFALMAFVTITACNRELKNNPATLMRPLPPNHGQKILLEKIGIIWKRLSFTWKVTMRNMFRYKKRAIMTIVGVAGCASLLLVAFGLRDSMDGVAQKQYGDILRYKSMIILKDDTDDISGKLDTLLKNERVSDPLLIRQAAFKYESGGNALDFYAIVPKDEALFNEFYSLTSTQSKGRVYLNNNSAMVTKRLAKIFKIKPGDTITIKDTDNNSYAITVTDIIENYTANYLYLNAAAYENVFGSPPAFNAIVYGTDDTIRANRLIDSGLITNVILTSDAIETVKSNTLSLNGVIVLIVVVASLLAIVVLYNLTAINISERTREIATLKVLGFRDSETNAYIYREALILTIISIAIGLGLGRILHRLLLDVIEKGALSLLTKVQWQSFLMSGVLTMVFSIFMQAVIYFKLKRIDMIESLKSVE